jgi:hypothetical protein
MGGRQKTTLFEIKEIKREAQKKQLTSSEERETKT